MGRYYEDDEEIFYENFDYEYFQYEELTRDYEICPCGIGHSTRFYKISCKTYKCEKKYRFNKSRRKQKKSSRWLIRDFDFPHGFF
ncbi:UNVERIFIED_CONTAM: hypothetical protein RMT77_005832 [Armadillidium vulgare]